MKKTLYIHAGTHKTGTTAIQKFLSANRDLLAKNGYLYPGTDQGHHDVARELKKFTLHQIRDNQHSATRACFDEIGGSKLRTIIISSEAFEVLGPSVETFRKFLDNRYDVKIIFYARRQDEKIEAMYNASVKNPTMRSTARFSDFISGTPGIRAPGEFFLEDCFEEFGGLDYRAILQPWREAFGSDNIIVRCYEKEQLPGGLFPDFFAAVGIRPDARYIIPAERINRSLHWDLIEILRQANIRYRNDPLFHRFLLNHLTRINREFREEKPHLLSAGARRAIIAQYAASNALVAREYLGRDHGTLFYEPVPDDDASQEAYQRPSEERITDLFFQVLHEILDHRKTA